MGAPVVREWGAASCRAAAGSAGAGQRVLAVLGVGGGEVAVQRLEVCEGEAAQAGEGRGAGGQALASDPKAQFTARTPFLLLRDNSNV